MYRLWNNCKYKGKDLFRSFDFVFWTLAYPIIMAIFFNAAFGGMLNPNLERVKIGISGENQMLPILEEIDFLDLHLIEGDEYEEKLYNEEIHGYVDDNLNLIVAKSGIQQTIIKEVLEQLKQTIKLNRPFDGREFSVNYVSSRDQKANATTIVFYSLIAMVSTYGVFAGIETVSLIQANLSNLGIRLNVTPLKKKDFLMAGTIVAFLLNLLSNVMLLLFIEYILKIELFKEYLYSLLLIILGNLFGIALGIFIGSSNKKSVNVKTVTGIAVTLFLSFLSGMMSPWIKIIIDKNVPIIGRINPISIISNNLYRINILGSTKSVTEGIVILLIYTLLLLFMSYIFLRRKSYDSI